MQKIFPSIWFQGMGQQAAMNRRPAHWNLDNLGMIIKIFFSPAYRPTRTSRQGIMLAIESRKPYLCFNRNAKRSAATRSVIYTFSDSATVIPISNSLRMAPQCSCYKRNRIRGFEKCPNLNSLKNPWPKSPSSNVAYLLQNG